MVGFKRPEEGPYECLLQLLDLSAVANAEKTVPLDWINEEHNNVNQKFIDYALPLIQGVPEIATVCGLPRYPKLKRVFAE